MIPDGQNGAETMEWYEDNRPETPLDIALADSGTADLQARCILSGVPEPHFEPTPALYSEIGLRLIAGLSHNLAVKPKHIIRLLGWAARPQTPPDVAFHLGARVMRLVSDGYPDDLPLVYADPAWSAFQNRFADTPLLRPLLDTIKAP